MNRAYLLLIIGLILVVAVSGCTSQTGQVTGQNKGETQTQKCISDWQCSEWSDCVDEMQTRGCIDTNNCGTTKGKPSELEACTSETIQPKTPKCTVDLQCSDWTPSKCPMTEIQTRTCTDLNHCDTTSDKPATTRQCEYVPTIPTQRPTVRVEDFRFVSLTKDSTTINLTLVINNSNKIGTTSKIDFDIYYKDERPLRGTGNYEYMGHSADSKNIRANDETTIHTYLTVKNSAVLQALLSMVVNQEVWIKVDGTATMNIGDKIYNIPFEKEVLVPLPK